MIASRDRFPRFQRRILRALAAAGALGMHEATLAAVLRPRAAYRLAGALAYLARAHLVTRGIDLFGPFARLSDRGRAAMNLRDHNSAKGAAGAVSAPPARTPAAPPT